MFQRRESRIFVSKFIHVSPRLSARHLFSHSFAFALMQKLQAGQIDATKWSCLLRLLAERVVNNLRSRGCKETAHCSANMRVVRHVRSSLRVRRLRNELSSKLCIPRALPLVTFFCNFCFSFSFSHSLSLFRTRYLNLRVSIFLLKSLFLSFYRLLSSAPSFRAFEGAPLPRPASQNIPMSEMF